MQRIRDTKIAIITCFPEDFNILLLMLLIHNVKALVWVQVSFYEKANVKVI